MAKRRSIDPGFKTLREATRIIENTPDYELQYPDGKGGVKKTTWRLSLHVQLEKDLNWHHRSDVYDELRDELVFIYDKKSKKWSQKFKYKNINTRISTIFITPEIYVDKYLSKRERAMKTPLYSQRIIQVKFKMLPGDQTLYRTRMTYDNYFNVVKKAVIGNLVRKSRARHNTASEVRAMPRRAVHRGFPGGTNFIEAEKRFKETQRKDLKRKLTSRP
jgi:hypothetical protein